MMFFFEGFSRLCLLGMVSFVCIANRVERDEDVEFTPTEWSILCLAITFMLYEYGDICRSPLVLVPSPKSLRMHFFEAWNVLDFCGYTLVVVWAGYVHMTYVGSSDDTTTQSDDTLLRPFIGCLACSTIFFTFGLLRFTTVYEGIGKLIVMLFAIIYELRTILFLFIVCMYGFCLVQYTLFKNSPYSSEYKTFEFTFLTQFSAALNNYEADFGVYKGQDYATLGIVVQVSVQIICT
jgi:hypothetical protein